MTQIGQLSPAERIARARQQSSSRALNSAPSPKPTSVSAPPRPSSASVPASQARVGLVIPARAPLVVVNPDRQPAPTENVNERLRRALRESRQARLSPRPATVAVATPPSEPAMEPQAVEPEQVQALRSEQTSGGAEPQTQTDQADAAATHPAVDLTGPAPALADTALPAERLVPEDIEDTGREPAKNPLSFAQARFQVNDIEDVISRPVAASAPAPLPEQPDRSKKSFRDRLHAALMAGKDFHTPESDMGSDETVDPAHFSGPIESDEEQTRPPVSAQAPGLTTSAPEAPVEVKPRQSLRERLLAASAASSQVQSSAGEDALDDPSDSRSGAGASTGDTEEVVGTLSALKVFNGWAVGTLWTTEREEVRVTGESIAELQEGLEYSLKGRTVNHSVHGDGFAVSSAMPVISPNDKAIEKYLVRSFVGIGEAKAKKYVEQTRESGGDEAVEALRLKLLNEPWSLDLSSISPKAAFSDGEDPQAALMHLMVTRNLMLRLGGAKGLRENTAKSLASHLIAGFNKERAAALKAEQSRAALADESQVDLAPAPGAGPGDIVTGTWSALMLNPYEPIGKASGYGFAMAEIVASAALIPRDSPLRLGALVDYAVEQGCQRRGHTFLRQGDITEAIKRVDSTAQPQQALIHAIRQGLVLVDDKRVYTPALHAAEKDVAQRLAALLQPADPLTPRTFADVQKRLAREPEKINPAFAGGFDIDQVKAVAGILLRKQRLHVLSGGPGTGKTAIMETLLCLLKSKKFAFCAPTGMAAKVLTARVSRYGYEASTCHSLLKGSEEEGFKVDENEPLECDVLVVDESTMNGIVMASALLKALPEHAHLIVLGDPGLPEKEGVPNSARAGQLPSISPGRFMQDLLMLPNVHHEHLTKTYRNSGGILEVIKEVSEGKFNTSIERPAVKLSHGLAEASVGFHAVMQEYLDRVAADGIEKTFLVMPLRKGDRQTPGWNSTYANHVLRQTCNPHGERLPGTTLHLGDRIVVRENMLIAQPKPGDLGCVRTAPNATQTAQPVEFDWAALAGAEPERDEDRPNCTPAITENVEGEVVKKRVVNGDKGTIVAYAMPSKSTRLGSPQWVRLALDDGRMVEFPGSEIASLQHAYAGTVHGAQGSEFKNVIMVVTPGTADFMNQNMLFTGLSRAQVSLSVHGEDRVLRKIAATPMPSRNSGIVDRVKTCLQELEKKKQEELEECSDEAPPHEA